MKAHTVKSNAKRAARKLADAFKWRCLEAAEPVAVDGAWHPAVQIIGANKVDPDVIRDVKDFIGNEAVIIGLPPKPAIAPARPKPVDKPVKPKPLAGAEFVSAVRSIPPTRSSADEIEARRAERRARVEEEKAAGLRDRLGNKIDPKKAERGPSRAAIIVALVSRPGGATVEDILTATGWQRHTLRGYIAGTLRKRGHDIQSVKGKPARYVMATEASA